MFDFDCYGVSVYAAGGGVEGPGVSGEAAAGLLKRSRQRWRHVRRSSCGNRQLMARFVTALGFCKCRCNCVVTLYWVPATGVTTNPGACSLRQTVSYGSYGNHSSRIMHSFLPC
jgi:hypothetical protein